MCGPGRRTADGSGHTEAGMTLSRVRMRKIILAGVL